MKKGRKMLITRMRIDLIPECEMNGLLSALNVRVDTDGQIFEYKIPLPGRNDFESQFRMYLSVAGQAIEGYVQKAEREKDDGD